MPKPIPDDYIDQRIERRGGHWIWTGPKDSSTGKPVCSGSFGSGSARLAIYRRERPDEDLAGKHIYCTCGEDLCVNPEHMEPRRLGSRFSSAPAKPEQRPDPLGLLLPKPAPKPGCCKMCGKPIANLPVYLQQATNLTCRACGTAATDPDTEGAQKIVEAVKAGEYNHEKLAAASAPKPSAPKPKAEPKPVQPVQVAIAPIVNGNGEKIGEQYKDPVFAPEQLGPDCTYCGQPKPSHSTNRPTECLVKGCDCFEYDTEPYPRVRPAEAGEAVDPTPAPAPVDNRHSAPQSAVAAAAVTLVKVAREQDLDDYALVCLQLLDHVDVSWAGLRAWADVLIAGERLAGGAK